MEKHRALKKKLFVLAGIFLVIISVLGGAWYLLFSQEASSGKDLKDAQRETRKTSGKIDAIEVKYELARNSIERYGILDKKLENDQLTISEQKIKQLMRKLNEAHRISNLKMVIEKISPLKQLAITKDATLETEFTNIDIEFDALSDMHALAFLQAVEDKLDGYLSMSSLSISRERQITREVLQAFAKGEKPRVVSTKVNYAWFGIKPTINDAQEVQSAQ